ncbi:MAG: phosphoribosylformylglycinamidine synthase subunit PurL [Planctomycetes bacterium]|nr:phosphoribosylformylglycinamidine synthase subunit PurL [Planctomycetota bacterium]
MSPATTTTAPRPARSAPNAWRIEVVRRAGVDDPAASAARRALADAGVSVAALSTVRGYLLPPELTRADAEAAAREVLADPVLDDAHIVEPGHAPAPRPGVQRVLVARKAGVMDPVALTVGRALVRAGLAAGAGGPAPFTATFRGYEIGAQGGAPIARETLLAAAKRGLANEIIEDVLVDDESLHFGPPPPSPRHQLVRVPLREADDARLEAISRDGHLSLSPAEMRAIQAHYRSIAREPTACELETIAQTWSEHCKHKTFTGIVDFEGEVIDNLLKRTIKAATLELDRPWCVSVFHDNAGIVEFDDGFDLAIKVETHNHPSALDPYGGAGTGVGGVVRDILGVGLGARPIANTDAFFVGPLDLPESQVPKGCMHPARILTGVVAGVRDYGNRMGIPTVSGGVWSHPGYLANPLVFAGTVGLLPRWAATKSVEPGDLVVVVGGRTGRDGIHGATFSSAELHEESEIVSGAAVQIGDAIEEKRVLDALLRARDERLYRAVTDCGAGGLSSAVGEMGAECGAEVDLELVPLKYPGLRPEEIWISEAQERMVLAVPPASWERLAAVFAAEDVEATAIGRFTRTGRLVLRYHGEVVGDLDLGFLHEGTPRPVRKASWSRPAFAEPGAPPARDHEGLLLRLLALPDIASKEWIVRQYDHEVQGRSVLKPLVGARMDGPGDAAVLQPLSTSRKGCALACGASPRYGELDPGAMAEAVIDEALRNVVAVGGDPDRTAILDNFSWGNCEKPDRLGALVLAARGCHRAAVAYGTPFVSGKDSLNNEYRIGERSIAIPPTLLVTALSIVPDVARTVSMDLKRAGSRLYLLGSTRAELGGSHYLALLGARGGTPPRPDLATAPRLFRALHRAIGAGVVLAAHDLSEGGLATAAAEMAFAGDLGCRIQLGLVPCPDLPAGFDPDATRLYSESCSRFLVEVGGGRAREFEAFFEGLPCAQVGTVDATRRLCVEGVRGGLVLDVTIDRLRSAHQSGFSS